MFKADTKDMKKLEKAMHQAPKHIRPAVAKTLNKQAADMKFQHIPNALQHDMTIRNEKFMHRQIGYNPAKPNTSPEQNYSEAGSIEAKRFTGWEEQQTGKKAEHDRVASQASRAGMQWKKQMSPSKRMNKAANFRRTSDYHAKTGVQRTIAMLKESRAQKIPFILRKSDSRPGRLSKMEPGLYGWVGKKLYRLQKFDTHYDPKTTDWMGDSLKMLFKKRGGFESAFYKEFMKTFEGLR